MRWLAIAVLLSGCDVIWRLDDFRGDGGTIGDARGDTGLAGERPSFCQSAAVFDDMTGSTPCGSWGAQLAST